LHLPFAPAPPHTHPAYSETRQRLTANIITPICSLSSSQLGLRYHFRPVIRYNKCIAWRSTRTNEQRTNAMHTNQQSTTTDTAPAKKKSRTPHLRAELGLLRVGELAGKLGIPVRTIYKLAVEGCIPGLLLAGTFYFHADAVEKALQRRAKERSVDDRRCFR
jgi:hypothetical protein